MEKTVERRRTGWDVIFGILLVIGGLVILGHAVLATVMSVLFVGWVTLVSGVVALVAAVFRIGKDGFWLTAISGGLLTVLGLVVVRHPGAAAVTLTLVAGSLFLAGGIMRIVAAFQPTQDRWLLAIGGVFSLALGLIVLFNIVEFTFTLLGVLLGVGALVDGIMLLLLGRLRVRESR